MRVSDLRIGLLYYLVGAERLTAVLLDQSGSSQTYALTDWKDIFPQVDALQDVLNGSFSKVYKINALEKFSTGWGFRLLPPLASLEPYNVLVIVPPAALYGLPFHAIRMGGDNHCLGEKLGISYCSSATLFQMCVSRNAARQANLSDWDFSTAGAPSTAPAHAPISCLAFGTDVLHDQDKAYKELAKEFSAFFQEADLSEISPRTSMKEPRYDVICLVCHGHYDENNPDTCGLLVSSPEGSTVERGIMLSTGNIFNFRDLPLHAIPMKVTPRPNSGAELFTVNEMKIDAECQAELVALLGCSTASGSPISINEPGTLAEQWLRAGAASVLANFWEIDLGFLKQWNSIFLDNWVNKRQPKVIAWRETIKKILSEEPDRPIYEWSCISILGDWL